MSVFSPGVHHVEKFFDDIWEGNSGTRSQEKYPAILIAHALGSGMPFFGTINNIFKPVFFVPKVHSHDHEVTRKLARDYKWPFSAFEDKDWSDRETMYADFEHSLDLKPDGCCVVFDVGGKLARGNALFLRQMIERHKLIVIEDTQNGHLEYIRLLNELKSERAVNIDNLLVWSVAHSSLKEPEDYWTGRGIVEATETIVRSNYGLIADQPASVFGYGKIGRSIAHALREKRLLVNVVEPLASRGVFAQCHGFHLTTESDVLKSGGIVFLATGNGADEENGLKPSFIRGFRKDAIITFATSHNDEIKGIEDVLKELVLPHPVKLTELNPELGQVDPGDFRRLRHALADQIGYVRNENNAKVSIVAKGRPPNFLFEASCGPYIYLVQAGLLAATALALSGQGESGQINSLDEGREEDVFKRWKTYFPGEGYA